GPGLAAGAVDHDFVVLRVQILFHGTVHSMGLAPRGASPRRETPEPALESEPREKPGVLPLRYRPGNAGPEDSAGPARHDHRPFLDERPADCRQDAVA